VFEFKGDGTFYMAKNPIGNTSIISTPRNDDNANLNLTSALDVIITSNEAGVINEWVFGIDGSLELPGSIISTPVSPTGGTDLVGEAATIIVTNGPNLNWNSTGVFANGINFTFTVDGSGNATVSINDGGTGHTVGETFTLSGSLVGGTTPADDVNFEITEIVDPRTALSLTKQVQILEDGFYTLADGNEGQIMYFVPASGTSTGTYVVIDNTRIIDVGNTDLAIDSTNYSWTPFFGETEAPRTIAMAIFADGAWCLRGGVND
jgi:hypothetical protein